MLEYLPLLLALILGVAIGVHLGPWLDRLDGLS